MGALQNVILTCIINSNIIYIVPEERAVFMREQASSLYSVSAYFLGKIMSEFPFNFLFPVLTAVIVYFPVGLNTEEDDKFVIFCK